MEDAGSSACPTDKYTIPLRADPIAQSLLSLVRALAEEGRAEVHPSSYSFNLVVDVILHPGVVVTHIIELDQYKATGH
jgi:hypothetical protein